jgi:hypothetical protein
MSKICLVALAALCVAPLACSKMDKKECSKLREDAFAIINSASVCTSDADCKASEWPGCAKAVSASGFATIHGTMEAFKAGKCEEKPNDCKPTPQVFCQEGLCAFKYKPSQSAPPDGMRIE